MDNIDMSAKRWLVCIDCGTTMAAGCDCGSTYEPKQDMAVTALKRSPEKSDRAIAAEIGVSDRTVNRARATSVAPDDNPLGDKPERRLGKDGKMYTKPKRKKVAKGKKGKALKPGRMYPGEFEGCDAIAYPKTTDGDQVTFNLRYLASEANNFRRRAEEFKEQMISKGLTIPAKLITEIEATARGWQELADSLDSYRKQPAHGGKNGAANDYPTLSGCGA